MISNRYVIDRKMNLPSHSWLRRYTLGIAVVILSLAFVSRAWAAPFEITAFSLQAIERTEANFLGSSVLNNPTFEFINVPYSPPFSQAGAHPWGLTTSFTLSQENASSLSVPTQDPKDIVGTLPPGLLGNPNAIPRCQLALVTQAEQPCPADTQVGVYRIHDLSGKQSLAPIVNVTPEVGQSAEFALETDSKIVNPLLTAHLVRALHGYELTVASNNIPESLGLYEAELTFWGVPSSSEHNFMRGLFCKTVVANVPLECKGGGEVSGAASAPFITMPTSCTSGPGIATLRADSWENPGSVGANQQYTNYVERTTVMPAVTGCNRLAFEPSIEVQPDTLLADEPVGVAVGLRFPQDENPNATATPELRGSVVTLPAGMSVSPGVVNGIQACEPSGPEGINFVGELSEETALSGELQLAAGHCPDASIVGTAEAVTPLLSEPLKGHVYLALPGCGGAGQKECTEEDAVDGNLYRLYLELGGTGEFANTGIHIKLLGKTSANPATGQLTTRFVTTPGEPETELPQLPASELHIQLNGGPLAPLANPPTCGPAVTATDLTPWSAPGTTPEGEFITGTPDATPSTFFEVGGCSSSPGLTPGFRAGTVATQAGAFTQFTMNLTRQDREQYIKGVQIKTPPGLLGVLSSVPLCGEPEANSGHCSAASQIGTTRVASGAGSRPFEIEGNVYLTGPHDGAPFGLSIVTHAQAGPFNLGLVVVRARIDVNQENSTLTVTTDESGPYAVPQIIFGVPLRLQHITVDINRPNFMFNPTNCEAQQITGVISGAQQAKAGVSTPFAVGGCKSLAFKPKFTAATTGKTSRSKGASLDVKLAYPAGSMGTEANVSKVKVDLPKQLPSRLSTLQKACLAATFDANPATCPAGSIVGVVRASTPILPVPLAGPVYFVSHGGEKFPSLVIVLQGDGVRVDLTGETFISKGITSSTFRTVPDVPVNTFELYLPQGKNSALAANGNFCQEQSKLVMPTLFTAQNGLQLKQSTKIAVSGCVSTHAKKKKKSKSARVQRGNSHGVASGRGRR